MSRTTSCLLAFVCLVAVRSIQAQDPNVYPGDDPPSTSLNSETANNTSACFAAHSPSYCTEALQANVTSTSAGNQSAGAQTLVVDAFPEHVSTISLHRLMNGGAQWTGQLLCEYQPWFSTDSTTGYNGHIDIGYAENSSSTVTNQDSKMINRGCNINFIDFYGTVNNDSTHGFNLSSTNYVYGDLWPRSNQPLKLGILEDQGSFDAKVAPYCGNQTPALSKTATESCIESALEKDMDYISQNYIIPHSGVYWADRGTNVIGYFGACSTFSALDCDGSSADSWNTIWNAVQGYVNGKSYSMKFIFQYGSFVYPTISAGAYAWPQPYSDSSDNDAFQDNPPSQYWWCDGFGYACTGSDASAYLDRYYNDAKTYAQGTSPEVAVGLLHGGFDDSNASWTNGRVIAQQCGHVLLDSANEVNKGGYWGTTNQMPYMMMATWNDYEEGSEQESGIDNCYTAVNLSFQTGSTTKVQWSLTVDPNSQGYQGTDTIHHYALWTSTDGGNTLTLKGQPKPPTSTFDLSTLHLLAGTYRVYVEMVGQPSIQNEMSSYVTYVQH